MTLNAPNADEISVGLASVFVVFVICALWRISILTKLIHQAGGNSSFTPPWKRVAEEQMALKKMRGTSLAKRINWLNGIAITSWLIGIGLLVTAKTRHL